MDSNRQYIDEKKFWYNHTCKKLKTGDSTEAREVINGYDFKKARYIILGIGTNDIETKKEEDVSKEIINIGMQLKKEYPYAKILLSQLTPRKDEFAHKIKKVNEILKRSIPESLYIIRNENLTTEILYDRKHLKRGSINMLIKNMKDAIRSTFKDQQRTIVQRSVNDYNYYPNHERNYNRHVNDNIKTQHQDTNTEDIKDKMLNIIKYMNSMINNK